jgi:hypothetical protein
VSGELVSIGEVVGCVVADEDIPVVGLVDEQLEGKFDGEAGMGEHELGEALRASDEDELRFRHGEAHLGGVAAVVDDGMDVEVKCLDGGDGAPQDLVDTPVAAQGDHTVWVVACHALTVRVPRSCSNPPAA